MVNIEEAEKYQEIKIYDDYELIGEAEIELTKKMLSKFVIYPPYRDRGYGTKALKKLTEFYGIKTLWVNADNKIAIKLYERGGFKKVGNGMLIMEREV